SVIQMPSSGFSFDSALIFIVFTKYCLAQCETKNLYKVHHHSTMRDKRLNPMSLLQRRFGQAFVIKPHQHERYRT
ncbi:hypothetical protein OFP26_36875, partial [Escherichia coli]|nr:hypothetical protein [Escherichia coli]